MLGSPLTADVAEATVRRLQTYLSVMSKAIALALLFLSAVPRLAAQPAPGAIPYLVPVYTTSAGVAGASGDYFSAQLVSFADRAFHFWPSAPEHSDLVAEFGPKKLFLRGTPPAVLEARIVYVEPDVTTRLTVEIFAIAEQDIYQNYIFHTIAKFPAPRLSEFTPSVLLLDIPFDWFRTGNAGFGADYPRFRHSVRIYSSALRPSQTVKVIVDGGTPIPLSPYRTESVVTLSRRDGIDESYPYYAVIPIVEQPCFIGLSGSRCPTFYPRIEVESTDGTPIWAFVSSTDNRTRAMTLTLPSK